MFASYVQPTKEEPEVDDGNDDFDGGPDVDLVSYEETDGPVQVDLASGTASGNGSDDIVNTESVNGTFYSDQITGSDADENLHGGRGADVLEGAGGDDVIRGGEDNDTMDGGPGTDEVNFEGAGQRLVVNLAGRASTGQGEDNIFNFEDVYGGYRNDFVIGDEGPNEIHGGTSGEDTLRGLAGNDMLIGGRDDRNRQGSRSTSRTTF